MKLVDYNRLAAQVEFGEKALFHILSCVEGLVTLRMILNGFFEVNQKLVTLPDLLWALNSRRVPMNRVTRKST